MSLPAACIRRPVFTTMLILLPVVLGLVSLMSMGVDLFPNVDIPVVFITTTRYGSSAEEMETGVTKRIEEAVNTISGIDELSSTSKEGISTVNIRFLLEKNRDVAQQEVQSKVNAILSQLPPGTDTPIIDKFDIDAAPVLSIAVSGGAGRTEREITEIADKRIGQTLASLKDVGSVTVVGGQKRAIQISVNTQKLFGYKIGIDEVRAAIASQNLEVPGGRIDQNSREINFRTMGRITDPAKFNDIIIKSVNGQPIRIRDVGVAKDDIEEPRALAELDGHVAVNLIVLKQSGSNTVEVINTVKRKLVDLEKALAAEGRGDIKMQVIRDQSRFIIRSMDEVTFHLLIGALLVSATILLFLRDWRTMLIASISIPVSIVSTFLAMKVAGFTFNNITMLALVMCVGIVIDDAVVVHENIFRWMEEKGLKAREASLGATNEVALAVMATTFSLVVIFLPIAFMSGTVGRFFQSFGITMAFAILISLFVSMTLTPMLCSRFLKLSKKVEEAVKRGDHSHHSGGIYGFIAEKPYMWLLRFSLRHRLAVVIAALLVMFSLFPFPVGNMIAGTPKPTDSPARAAQITARQKKLAWANYPGLASLLGFDFIPQDDQSEFEVAITMPPNTTLSSARDKCAKLADQLKVLPGVIHTLITIGDTSGKLTRATGDVTKASVYVALCDLEDRPHDEKGKRVSQFDLMDRARKIIAGNGEYTDLRASVQIPAALSSGAANADIEFTVSGPDLDGLQNNVDHILALLRATPGLADVNTTIPDRNSESRNRIDTTRAAELGLNIRSIANALQTVVGGQVVSDYKDDSNGELYDVWLRGDAESRSRDQRIADTALWSQSVGMVTLSNVATQVFDKGPSQIDHFMRQRKISIVANLAIYPKENRFLFFHWTTRAKMPTGEGVAAIQKVIDSLRNPDPKDPVAMANQLTPAYSVDFLGRAKTMAQSMTAFLIAFGLSLIFMYMILAAQFESFLHPITILLAVPLTIPFAVLSLLLLGQSANLYAILGVFLLFGIVKKNGILQVDYSNQLIATGMERNHAVLEANKTRLRPILMTTVMLVASMIPIALGQGAGAASRASMAKVIIGGQTLSLLLTLVVTPVAFTLFDDLGKGRLFRFLRIFKPKKKTPPPAPRPTPEPEPTHAAK